MNAIAFNSFKDSRDFSPTLCLDETEYSFNSFKDSSVSCGGIISRKKGTFNSFKDSSEEGEHIYLEDPLAFNSFKDSSKDKLKRVLRLKK